MCARRHGARVRARRVQAQFVATLRHVSVSRSSRVGRRRCSAPRRNEIGVGSGMGRLPNGPHESIQGSGGYLRSPWSSWLRGPATTDIDSPRLRGRCRVNRQAPLILSVSPPLISMHGNSRWNQSGNIVGMWESNWISLRAGTESSSLRTWTWKSIAVRTCVFCPLCAFSTASERYGLLTQPRTRVLIHASSFYKATMDCPGGSGADLWIGTLGVSPRENPLGNSSRNWTV